MVRSLGETGRRCIVADFHRGPAMRSRYAKRCWLLRSRHPGPEAVDEVLDAVRRLGMRCLLLPDCEAWTLALVEHRETVEQWCDLPFGDSDTIRLVCQKTRMHRWCEQRGIRVPHALLFMPGEDWQAFLTKVEAAMPIFLKPETKGLFDDVIGFLYRPFNSIEELRAWAATQDRDGPPCPIICQEIIPGPPTSLSFYQGYRSRDGRVYMTGCTKLRMFSPHYGGSTATYLRADAEARDESLAILETLDYHGIFDLEFKRHAETGELIFIELNPRAGMLSYASTAYGINLAHLAWSEKAGRPLPPSRIISKTHGIWIRTEWDLLLHVLHYRMRGEGISARRWLWTLLGHRLIDAHFNLNDISVWLIHMADFLGFCLRKAAGRFLTRRH